MTKSSEIITYILRSTSTGFITGLISMSRERAEFKNAVRKERASSKLWVPEVEYKLVGRKWIKR